MELKEHLEVKNIHKDIILNTVSKLATIIETKDEVFKKNDEYIWIGEEKYDLEELMLNKIPLTDNIIKTIEDELMLIKERFLFSLKYKNDKIDEINNKLEELEQLTNQVLSNRNAKVIDILNVISNSYQNILTLDTLYTDNLELSNGNYLFFNGERTLLNKNQYKVNEVSQNYRIEITISRAYLSYVVFNDILKTLDTFKVYFIDGTTQVKFVKEFLLQDKIIEVNGNVTKIIIEGLGAAEICNDIKICVGKNQTNMNRGIAVVDCDFSKVKIANYYHISAHEDIKIFLWKKDEVDFQLPYNDFKEKYYLLEKLVDTNISTTANLIDNYLVLFIESNLPMLNQIKIYGTDS